MDSKHKSIAKAVVVSVLGVIVVLDLVAPTVGVLGQIVAYKLAQLLSALVI